MKKWKVLAASALALVGTACGTSSSQSSTSQSSVATPTIVVTHAILASVVKQVVGDAAAVRTVIPNGTDPHEYAPSPRDIEALFNADLIVRNGGGFDESLDRVIKDAQRNGVPVFIALDHVTSPPSGVAGDPHFFTDPKSMSQIIAPFAQQFEEATGVNLGVKVESTLSQLDAVSKQIQDQRARLSADDDCVLITGHESLAYLASRYKCTVLGTVIPGLSSSAEASAADLAALKTLAQDNKVRAIFVESTMSTRVAVQLANELEVAVVPLDVEMLGDDGLYDTYVTELMTRIVDGLLGNS